MTVQLHTGSRTVTIGADFLVWDVPCRVVLTDPWQLREAREVLRRELTELDRAARPRVQGPAPQRPRGRPAHPAPAGTFPYGVTTAPANGVVHHSMAALGGLETGRGRRRPLPPPPRALADGDRRAALRRGGGRGRALRRARRHRRRSRRLRPRARGRLAHRTARRVRRRAHRPRDRRRRAEHGSGCPPAARCASSSSPRRRARSSRCGATSSCSAPPRPPPTPPLPARCCAVPPRARGLPGCGLGARLVDAHGAGQEVGCWPDRTATPVGPA